MARSTPSTTDVGVLFDALLSAPEERSDRVARLLKDKAFKAIAAPMLDTLTGDLDELAGVFQAALELPREHSIHAGAAALVRAGKVDGPILVSLADDADATVRYVGHLLPSPDGAEVYAVENDGTSRVSVWSAETGAHLRNVALTGLKARDRVVHAHVREDGTGVFVSRSGLVVQGPLDGSKLRSRRLAGLEEDRDLSEARGDGEWLVDHEPVSEDDRDFTRLTIHDLRAGAAKTVDLPFTLDFGLVVRAAANAALVAGGERIAVVALDTGTIEDVEVAGADGWVELANDLEPALVRVKTSKDGEEAEALVDVAARKVVATALPNPWREVYGVEQPYVLRGVDGVVVETRAELLDRRRGRLIVAPASDTKAPVTVVVPYAG